MPDTPVFDPTPQIAEELGLAVANVQTVVKLLQEGNTIPFIARYRKEMTGALDEVQIRTIEERNGYMVELNKRREAILASIEEQGKLTEGLRKKILAATTKAVLEDLYLPYKPKRRTRGTIAKEKGLEPLALRILEQPDTGDPLAEAEKFVDAEKGVNDVQEALAGARDIAAEIVAENADIRTMIRGRFAKEGLLLAEPAPKKEEEAAKYKDYFEFKESVATIPSHRFLAVRRGERESLLRTSVFVESENAIGDILAAVDLKASSPFASQLQAAVEDSYKRLIAPSVESDLRTDLKMRSDRAAVEVFGSNLRSLLLAAPFGGRRVVGVDPGLRTGCKCAAVDETGKFLGNMTFNLVKGESASSAGREAFLAFCRKHKPEAIAVGNGTGGRETEKFIRESIKGTDLSDVIVLQVSEAGASVYSASELAAKEFPDLDLTIRGAISIARRLQDPLAELVKIEPKSIGVGQYQHDVHQPLLVKNLDEVVESCVNHVGVELNTASAALLSRVAGIGPTIAANIVATRDDKGAFRSRKEVLKVPKLGPRTFEQCAGFLRIRDAANPLDSSAVHPERYQLVERMAEDLGAELASLVGDASLADRIDISRYVGGDVGEPTLRDIVSELKKPGRDPRDSFEPPAFREDVQTMEDLREGMELEGIVSNVTAFGAFVDVGVHQDGLVHVSELADRFVKDPAEVVKVGDKIRVRVLGVDLPRKRISLSAKSGAPASGGRGGPRNGDSRENREGNLAQGSRNKKARKPQEKFSYNPFADLLKK